MSETSKHWPLLVFVLAPGGHVVPSSVEAKKSPLEEARGHKIPIDGRITEINDALTRLEQLDPRPAAVVEMRYFGGLTEQEIADVLGISVATVKRDWEYARSWLLAQLNVS